MLPPTYGSLYERPCARHSHPVAAQAEKDCGLLLWCAVELAHQPALLERFAKRLRWEPHRSGKSFQ